MYACIVSNKIQVLKFGVEEKSNIKKNKFVSFLLVVGNRTFYRIPSIAKIYKIGAFHHTTIGHIQTRYNSLCEHAATNSDSCKIVNPISQPLETAIGLIGSCRHLYLFGFLLQVTVFLDEARWVCPIAIAPRDFCPVHPDLKVMANFKM